MFGIQARAARRRGEPRALPAAGQPLGAYARATRCPVLTSRVLRAGYVMPGTDIACAARSPVLTPCMGRPLADAERAAVRAPARGERR
eukprot:1902746-Rhodomonas_salina.1